MRYYLDPFLFVHLHRMIPPLLLVGRLSHLTIPQFRWGLFVLIYLLVSGL